MTTWKDSFALDGKPAKWTYDMGVILKGFEGAWMNSGDVKYYNYILKQVDFFVNNDGTIKTYKPEDYNIDNVFADYADEGMIQYLRTERVIPPYQTKGYKLIELLRIYESK